MGLNNFIALAPIGPGTPTGPLAAIDLFALVSATGLNPGFTVICTGDFEGTISIEGSLLGVKFSPIGVSADDDNNLGVTSSEKSAVGGFTLGKRSNVQATSPTYQLSPLIVPDVIRFFRVNIAPQTIIRGNVQITLGGEQNCDCASGGGGGAVIFTDTVRSNPTAIDGAMDLDLFPSQVNTASALGTNAGAVTLSMFRLVLTSWNADAGSLGQLEIVHDPIAASGPDVVVYTLAVGALPGDGSTKLVTDLVGTAVLPINRRWRARLVWAGGSGAPASGAAVDATLTMSMAPT